MRSRRWILGFAALAALATVVPIGCGRDASGIAGASGAVAGARAVAPVALRAEVVERIEQAVASVLEDHRIPGLSVAVRGLDGTEWTRGFGVADVENGVPATADTVYRLASISKPITAVAVLSLVERGRLDLDADVRTYVPGFPHKQWTVTCRQLCGHLGGVRHYEGDRAELLSNRRYATVAEALEIFASDPLLHEPGTAFHYTTYGYNLLGAAAAAAAGARFGALLRESVFEPAGMETMRVDDHYAIVPSRAQGYVLQDGELRNAAPVDTSNKVPGGGLCGTPRDLVRFAGALLEGKLLRPETREEMWTSMTLRDDTPTGYGYGWRVGEVDGRRVVEHGGAQPRVSTLLYVERDAGWAVAVMCNLERQGGTLRELAPQVAALVRGP